MENHEELVLRVKQIFRSDLYPSDKTEAASVQRLSDIICFSHVLILNILILMLIK